MKSAEFETSAEIDKAKIKPKITFDQVKEMLKAHLELLLQHRSYILDIEKRKIDGDELHDYLDEIFDFSIPQNGKFHTEYLPSLKNAVQLKITIFLTLLRIANHANENVALSTLYFSLESELFYAKLDVRMARTNGIPFQEKVTTALNRAEFITSLRKHIATILPESHNKLTNYICQESKQEKATRENGGKKGQYYSNYKYKWDGLRNDVMKYFESFTKKFTKNTTKDSIQKMVALEAEKIDGFNDLVNQIIQSYDLDSNYTELPQEFEFLTLEMNKMVACQNQINLKFKSNSKDDSATITVDVYNNLLCNVVFFYNIDPLHIKLVKVSQCMSSISGELQDLNKRILNVRDLFNAALKGMQKQQSLAVKKIDSADEFLRLNISVLESKNMGHEVNLLSTFLTCLRDEFNHCKVISAQLGDKFRADIDKDLIGEISADHAKQIALINQILKEFNSVKNTVLEKKNQSSSIQTDPDLPEKESLVPLKEDHQRKVLLEEARIKDQEYRALVEQRKLERLQKKKVTVTTKKQEVSNAKMLFFKNITLEDRLIGMSDKQLVLLMSLHRLEKGIRYHEICNLITQHLGGEIEEFGSSHKRIRIAKYYVQITSRPESDATAEVTKPDTHIATGGMFRPHGHAHQSGVMSRFNMLLVTQTLKKAGITEQILLEIQDKRSAQEKSARSDSEPDIN